MNEKEKNLFEARAKILKAISHPTRLWIAHQLLEGEKCVCNFVDAMDFDFSTISKHLSILKQAGIVQDRKEGKQVFYSLRVPCLLSSLNCVDDVIRDRAKLHADMLDF